MWECELGTEEDWTRFVRNNSDEKVDMDDGNKSKNRRAHMSAKTRDARLTMVGHVERNTYACIM